MPTNDAFPGKAFHLQQCCLGDSGVVVATALDARGSLKDKLEKAGKRTFSCSDIETFKLIVTKSLSKLSSGMLLDLKYAKESRKFISDTKACGLLIAYEAGSKKDGPPPLAKDWSVERIRKEGGNGVKLLVYYNVEWTEKKKKTTHDFVQKVGEECKASSVPFFLEVLTLDEKTKDKGNGLAHAQKKPMMVVEATREFSSPKYCADVLKMEFPVIPAYVDGLKANENKSHGGNFAYSIVDAQRHLQAMSKAAKIPFIFLSAGVDMTTFLEMLTLAGHSKCKFSGVLCGRATWKDAVKVFANDGEKALEDWVSTKGLQNLKALKDVLEKHATPLRITSSHFPSTSL